MADAADAVRIAAEETARRALPWLRTMAVGFGLPTGIAATLQLTWDGTMFRATSGDPRLKEYEYGDGKKPPLAPIRKSMTRLEPQILSSMEELLAQGDLIPQVQY